MNKIIPYLILIIVVLIGWLMYKELQNLRDENDRLLHNMEQRLMNRQDEVLALTKKELIRYNQDTLLTKLMDSLSIKARQITGVINHKYRYVYDTTIYLVIDTLKPMIKRFGVKFNDCVSVYGFVDTSTVTFDSIPINYNATSVYYWRRPNKFWFIRYGKKQYFSDTKNNCTGESKVQRIDIIK